MKRSVHFSSIKHNTIVRIAPVCKGMIYVIPHTTPQLDSPLWDIPIIENLEKAFPIPIQTIRKTVRKYHRHIQTLHSPRYSVRHKSSTDSGHIISLYILPLSDTSEINFREGRFVTSDEIRDNKELYSLDLQQESELLGIAAELWDH